MDSLMIIGGGATGTLLAVNLVKLGNGLQPLTINLIEKRMRVGRGVAYSTTDDIHLLNVPAGKMGAFPDDIEHFHKWLTENGYDYAPSAFVPRRIYGEYLQRLLDQAVETAEANISFNYYNEEAIDLAIENGRVATRLASGAIVNAEKAALAFGNFLPPNLKTASSDYLAAAKYFPNPWDDTLYEKLAPTDEVLIIGTGLTMVDAVLSLYEREHQGKIRAISTHGWLPAVHKLGFVYPAFAEEFGNAEKVSQLLKVVRRHLAEAENGNDWRGVIDALRPATQKLWRGLPDAEKRRFMRHLRRRWDVARHRIPSQCADLLEELQNAGRLEIIKGRVVEIKANEGSGFEVIYQVAAQTNAISADAIINCTGSESNFARVNTPLVRNLIAGKHIRPDALALGIDAAPNGVISDQLYTIGTALKGILWESTAMPELRAQAAQLASELLARAATV